MVMEFKMVVTKFELSPFHSNNTILHYIIYKYNGNGGPKYMAQIFVTTQ